MKRCIPAFGVLSCAAALLVLQGCGRVGARVYEAPRETPKMASENPAPLAGDSSAGLPSWTVPAGWIARVPGPMRLAEFDLQGGAVASVTRLPGSAGGLAANINRWRGQLGLPVVTEAEAVTAVRSIRIAAADWNWVDLDGPPGGAPVSMAVAATVRGGDAWFFKLMGPPASVRGGREDLKAFVESVAWR